MSEGHSYFDAEGKGDIKDFLKSYMDQYQKTVGKGYISLPLGNHDNARLGNKRTDKELEIIYAFGFTMPGVPFLYYGNEIGMRQLPNDWPQVEGAYQPRNGARTPMQWSTDKNLGFSTGDAANLYLPVDPAPDAPNVATQEKNPQSRATLNPRWPTMLSSCPSILAKELLHPTPSSMPVQQATMWYSSCSTPRLKLPMPPSPST